LKNLRTNNHVGESPLFDIRIFSPVQLETPTVHAHLCMLKVLFLRMVY